MEMGVEKRERVGATPAKELSVAASEKEVLSDEAYYL